MRQGGRGSAVAGAAGGGSCACARGCWLQVSGSRPAGTRSAGTRLQCHNLPSCAHRLNTFWIAGDSCSHGRTLAALAMRLGVFVAVRHPQVIIHHLRCSAVAFSQAVCMFVVSSLSLRLGQPVTIAIATSAKTPISAQLPFPINAFMDICCKASSNSGAAAIKSASC